MAVKIDPNAYYSIEELSELLGRDARAFVRVHRLKPVYRTGGLYHGTDILALTSRAYCQEPKIGLEPMQAFDDWSQLSLPGPSRLRQKVGGMSPCRTKGSSIRAERIR